MKMRATIALLAFVFSIGPSIEASAQQPTRIRFAKGANSALIKATTGPFGTRYVLRARAGQKLIIGVTPASVLGVKVETVGQYGNMVLLREQGGGHYEVGLEEAGDYTIFVGPLGRNPVSFTLTVKIAELADI
jgi:hypothetical protein